MNEVAPEAVGNPFGIMEAVVGIAVGFVLSSLAGAAHGAATGHGDSTQSAGLDIVTFVALWAGFVGAVVVATRSHAPAAAADSTAAAPSGTGSIVADYGFRFRPWPDLPLGVAVGVAPNSPWSPS